MELAITIYVHIDVLRNIMPLIPRIGSNYYYHNYYYDTK